MCCPDDGVLGDVRGVISCGGSVSGGCSVGEYVGDTGNHMFGEHVGDIGEFGSTLE